MSYPREKRVKDSVTHIGEASIRTQEQQEGKCISEAKDQSHLVFPGGLIQVQSGFNST